MADVASSTRVEEQPSDGAEPRSTVGAVLVIGGGVSGIQASLDLAGSGFKVYLGEEGPSIGGRFRLNENGSPRFRVKLPLRVVERPKWTVE